jgi:pyridoxal phosphate enzyme (YggS family)
MSTLAERYRAVQERIDAAAVAAGRDPKDVTLIVVSKFHPAQLVLELIELGARDFGENKDQEAGPKSVEVAETLAQAGKPITHRWHFVGQLQSNKVKSVLRYASAIHSLDRDSLLTALAKETSKLQEASYLQGVGAAAGEAPLTPIDVFIELNLTDDPGRGGIVPANVEEFAQRVLQVPGLNLMGVMGVASLNSPSDPSIAERDFEAIQRASFTVRGLKPEAKFISAGMSGDFETALKFGATHLRIGTAITGERAY